MDRSLLKTLILGAAPVVLVHLGQTLAIARNTYWDELELATLILLVIAGLVGGYLVPQRLFLAVFLISAINAALTSSVLIFEQITAPERVAYWSGVVGAISIFVYTLVFGTLVAAVGGVVGRRIAKHRAAT